MWQAGREFMITIKQIAELCGVSRGTVDRVINGRGNVKEEKRAQILKTMAEFGYRPNPAARALVSQKQCPVAGIVIAASEIQFFSPIITALRKAADYYGRFGLETQFHLLTGYSVREQCDAIAALRAAGAEALIINPINDPEVISSLEEAIADGIFVVSLNNDFETRQPHIYVGCDYEAGGRTAAALLRKICRGSINAGVSYSGERMLGHLRRVEGFRSRLAMEESCSVVAVEEDSDDDIHAYEETLRMIDEHPEMNAFFIATSGGAHGVCQAFVKRRRTQDVTIVTFDTIPAIERSLRAGIIDAAIYQHPRRQGEIAMQLTYDRLISGIAPSRERYIMQNEIRIIENF
ncbi:transcriptional regulator, LacI family [Selenomonas artemidis F0399]|uniref:Transcriptional regulator, LacI family n=2 Tax=Selenomonas TaxID=970 RepID=E7N2A3_9FIRM|nr:transcriptional regulator, LacI family [Selenomonas artemidis F0399]